MLLYGFLLILLLRPSWGLWGLFSIVLPILFLLVFMAGGYDLSVSAIGALVQGAIFSALAAVIVGLRLWLRSRKSRQDKNVDAELERFRAEAAARVNEPPQS